MIRGQQGRVTIGLGGSSGKTVGTAGGSTTTVKKSNLSSTNKGTGKITSVPNAPTRKLKPADKAILAAHEMSQVSHFMLEDPVTVADSKSVALQGVVAYVGNVHFADGIWVGIQLTGPSLRKGRNDGAVKGRRYFANVGRKNGIFAPVEEVHKRVKAKTGDPELDAEQEQRQTIQARMADVKFVETLKKERSLAILQRNQEKQRFMSFHTEQRYVQRLKQERLDELRQSRGQSGGPSVLTKTAPKPKFGTKKRLEQHDYEFMKNLEMTQQNYCLSDPTLPDNPVVFASQAFLNMTGYHQSEILGRNCRFLQGPKTDRRCVNYMRRAILEGSDCSVCLLNYRADGSPFYNHCFVTALRDERGRIKNYIGVQCEVTAEFAFDFNEKLIRGRQGSRRKDESGQEPRSAGEDQSLVSSAISSVSGPTNPPHYQGHQYYHQQQQGQEQEQQPQEQPRTNAQPRSHHQDMGYSREQHNPAYNTDSPELSWRSGSDHTAPLTPGSGESRQRGNRQPHDGRPPLVNSLALSPLEEAFARAAMIGGVKLPLSAPPQQQGYGQHGYHQEEQYRPEDHFHHRLQQQQQWERAAAMAQAFGPAFNDPLTFVPPSPRRPQRESSQVREQRNYGEENAAQNPASPTESTTASSQEASDEQTTNIVPAQEFEQVQLEARTYRHSQNGQQSLTQLEVVSGTSSSDLQQIGKGSSHSNQSSSSLRSGLSRMVRSRSSGKLKEKEKKTRFY